MIFILKKFFSLIPLVLFVQTAEVSPPTGLRNKHVRIAVSYWPPFLMWQCPELGYDWEEDCPHERTSYDGVMWDLLMFLQQARNFTFTLIHEPNFEWGSCSAINNCTGMVAMVNMKEVDFALGRFGR